MKILNRLLCAVLILTLALSSIISITAFADDIKVYLDNELVVFPDQQPVEIEGRTLLPIRPVTEKMGLTVGWVDETQTATVSNDEKTVSLEIGSPIMTVNTLSTGAVETVEMDTYARLIGDGINDRTCLPVRFVVEQFGAGVGWDDANKSVIINTDGSVVNTAPGAPADVMADTVINDNYRLSTLTGKYGAVSIFDGYFGMEFPYITDRAAADYANTINQIAANFPEINVYNIIAPTASEFYAPKEYSSNELDSIKKVYSQLSQNVIPVNVVKTLMEHAGEKIYFTTDHHWTQRGAYYAYAEFARVTGQLISPITAFADNGTSGYVGSLANFTKGTEGETILRANPDYLERLMPNVSTEGAAYSDMGMTNYIREVKPVSTSFNSYLDFISGDNPLTVIKTDVKNGKKIVIVKESYGNAFATWAVNNYEEVYVVDFRKFNSFGANGNNFSLLEFYNQIGGFDDLVIISYPVTVGASELCDALAEIK